MDGKSDPVTVGNVAKQMVQKGAVAIIAPSDFDFGGPASREAQSAGIVGISPAASSPLYGSAALGDKQFTMSMWNTTMGAATAEYAKKQGWNSTYVITDDFIDYTKSLSKYFIARYKELGGNVLFEDTYTQGQGDISAQVARIKALPQKPDFIYISSYMPDLALMIRTLRESGITAPVVGGDSYDDPGLFDALGTQYGNDVVFDTHGFLSKEANAKYPEFAASYEKKFGNPPDALWVMPGYDAVMVLAQAMETAKSTDGAAVAKAMEQNEFDLLTGKLEVVGCRIRPPAEQGCCAGQARERQAGVPGMDDSREDSGSVGTTRRTGVRSEHGQGGAPPGLPPDLLVSFGPHAHLG